MATWHLKLHDESAVFVDADQLVQTPAGWEWWTVGPDRQRARAPMPHTKP